MKNSKINPLIYAARFLGYALLIAGFFWLFIVIPMFSRVITRRVMEQSEARLAERTQSTFTLRDMETEAHASIKDSFALYPKHTIPTLLMVAGGIVLAYTPRSNWKALRSEQA
jgi:sterol desaturase/sphingolipid hydroxylase (fatty acid hydroxylase superfamily)